MKTTPKKTAKTKEVAPVDVVTGFKGFDANLKCRDMQYKENTEFTFDGDPILCERGLHFCEMPLDVFSYYPPLSGREYATVEAHGLLKKDNNKTVTNNLKINTKISIGNLGENSIAVSLGVNGWAKGAFNCWIVLTEWEQQKDYSHKILSVQSFKVDNELIKADTFYKLVNGKPVEAE